MILIRILIVLLCVAIYFFLKNINTYNCRMAMIHAIGKHNIYNFENGERISYKCMRPYAHCLYVRFWDWGSKNIIEDPDIYEKIKPYFGR